MGGAYLYEECVSGDFARDAFIRTAQYHGRFQSHGIFSDSLGHGAFTGIAIGVLLGFASPLTSLMVFSVGFALFITYIKTKSTASTDTIIGVFLLRPLHLA